MTSVGSRGDSYDNALAESVIGLYKAELVRRKGPWRGLDDLEYATRSRGCPARRRTSAAVRCSGYLSLGTPYTRSISGITLEGGA